jgi:hypothetical protein
MTPQHLAESEDRRRRLSSDKTDLQIAISLEHQMRQLSEYLGEARIGNVRLLADRLQIFVDLNFVLPLPSGREGDWLATPEDVRAFRLGFRDYLRTESKTPKLSNLLYAEYLAFIRSYMRIYRFGKNVVRRLPKTAERRLAGRPRYSVSRVDEQFLRNEIDDIKSKLLEMKKLISVWNAKSSLSKEDAVKTKIRKHFPREQFLWMKFFFSSFKKLPAKRRNTLGDHLDRQLSKPASWSAMELALLLVQEVYYRRKGIELSILMLRKLLPDPETRNS